MRRPKRAPPFKLPLAFVREMIDAPIYRSGQIVEWQGPNVVSLHGRWFFCLSETLGDEVRDPAFDGEVCLALDAGHCGVSGVERYSMTEVVRSARKELRDLSSRSRNDSAGSPSSAGSIFA